MKIQLTGAKSGRLKERYKQQYREPNRKVKRLARADKRMFLDDLASQAEDAANKGEARQSVQNHRDEAPVKDKLGSPEQTTTNSSGRHPEGSQHSTTKEGRSLFKTE